MDQIPSVGFSWHLRPNPHLQVDNPWIIGWIHGLILSVTTRLIYCAVDLHEHTQKEDYSMGICFLIVFALRDA